MKAFTNYLKRTFRTFTTTKGETIALGHSVKLNYQLEIVGDESVNSIDLYEEFYVNLRFDRSIYRPIAHMD